MRYKTQFSCPKHFTFSSGAGGNCPICGERLAQTTERRFVEGLVPLSLSKIHDRAVKLGHISGQSQAIIEVGGKLKILSLANIGSGLYGSHAQRIVEMCGAKWHGHIRFINL